MQQTVTLVIYTTENILTFDVVATTPDFGNKITEALDAGALALTLADGGTLIISDINYVAIEIKAPPDNN